MSGFDIGQMSNVDPLDPAGSGYEDETYLDTAEIPVMNIQPEGADGYAAFTVTFGQEPFVVLADDTERKKANITNLGPQDVVLGELPEVVGRTGYRLLVGKDLEITTVRQVYAAPFDRTSSNAGNLTVWVERNYTAQ